MHSRNFRRRLLLESLENRLLLAADLDDEISEATVLGAASTAAVSVDGVVLPDIDVDMYRFTVAAGQSVDFDLDTLINGPGGLDAYLRIFDSRGDQLAQNDDAFAPGEDDLGFDSFLRHTFSSAGTYYLGVSNATNVTYDAVRGDDDLAGGANATGPYTLTMQALPADDDDTRTEATVLGSISATPITIDATIAPDIDVDVYRFTVSSGQTVDFDIDTALNGPGGLGSYLRLFNAQGDQLAANDDGMAPDENLLGLDAFLRHTFSSGGTHYLAVSNAANTQYNVTTGAGDTAGGLNAIGDYRLIVQTAPAVVDDADDEISEATALGSISTGPKTTAAGISPNIDVDMYRFSVTANTWVDFDVDTVLNGRGGLGSYLRLFNSQGQELAANNAAIAPGENSIGFDAYLRYAFSSAGTYYLAVSNANNTSYSPTTGEGDVAGGEHATGDYTLTLQALPIDEDDELSEATNFGTITRTGDMASDDMETDIDVDMFRFSVTAGQVVDFDVDTADNGAPGLNSMLRLFDSQGQELAANQAGAAPGELVVSFDPYLRYTFTSGGVYFLGVSSHSNGTYNATTGANDTGGGGYTVGTYALIVQTAPDDPEDGDDETSEATVLGAVSTAAVTVEADITPDVDVDMYRFTVSAGQVVDFDLDTPLNGPGGLGSYLRLFNSQGTTLAQNNNATAPGENQLGLDAYLRYTFASGGTYYLGVSNATNTDYDPRTGNDDTAGGNNAVGSYRLTVQALPNDTDDSLSEAVDLGAVTSAPQTVSDSIVTDVDVDMYRFTVAADQLVGFDIDTPLNGPGGLGSYVRLFNDAGQQIAFNDDGAAPGEPSLGFDAYLQHAFLDRGTYYLGVSNANNTQYQPLTGAGDTAGGADSLGSYTLIVRAISTEDPALSLSVSPTTIREDGGRVTATVSRSNGDDSEALVITLSSEDTSEASVPATVTIPAHSTSATFAIVGVDDALLDGTQTVLIRASAAGYAPATETLRVTDVETVTVTVSPSTISESGGTATGTVTRSNTDTTSAVSVILVSSDETEATVPASVVIPAGQAAATFNVTARGDAVVDGTQTVTISALATGYQEVAATVDVTDDDGGPGLVLTVSNNVLSEDGGATTGVVSRTGSELLSALVVNLASSDTTAAVVPASVVIPVGASSASFTITAVDDDATDGMQRATITATAIGFSADAQEVLVADDELPYQNPVRVLDVNGDTFVSPLDALLLINILNQYGAGPVTEIMDQYDGPAEFPDTSGDNYISPIDTLLIINWLNLGAGASGESESATAQARHGTSSNQPLDESAVDEVYTRYGRAWVAMAREQDSGEQRMFRRRRS